MDPKELMKNLPVDKSLKKQISPIKKPVPKPVIAKPVESPVKEKPAPRKIIQPVLQPPFVPEEKKPKPEMRDAITQTDRSDWQIIKARMLREKEKEASSGQSSGQV
jgi:hypothetical protein